MTTCGWDAGLVAMCYGEKSTRTVLRRGIAFFFFLERWAVAPGGSPSCRRWQWELVGGSDVRELRMVSRQSAA